MRLWRKGNPLALLVGMPFGTATIESSMEIPQIIKNGSAFDPAIPLLGTYLKELKKLTQKEHKTPIFIAALFTIFNI